jgi:ABC-type sugar transport system permease subunit
MTTQQRLAPYIFVAPFVILFCIFGIYPICKSVILSLYITSGPKYAVFNGLGNYKFLMEDPLFWKAVGNTLKYTLAMIVLQVPLALGLAILLTQKWLKGKNIYRLAIFSPNLMGSVAVGVLFSILFQPQFGLINKLISGVASLPGMSAILGNPAMLLEKKWLGEDANVMPAIVIASLWMSVGFSMIYFLAALQGVDKDLYEAASVDGASEWQKFLHVTIPAIMPVLTFVLVTTTIGSLQLFELPYLLLGNGAGPNNAGLTIVMYLFNNGFSSGDLGYASAVGWTLAVGMLAISLIQVRLTGSMKNTSEGA